MQTIQRLVKVKIRLMQTVVSYFLAISGCLLISFDVPYAYVFYLVSCVVIIGLNFKDVKNICVSMSAMLKKITKKKNTKMEG